MYQRKNHSKMGMLDLFVCVKNKTHFFSRINPFHELIMDVDFSVICFKNFYGLVEKYLNLHYKFIENSSG